MYNNFKLLDTFAFCFICNLSSSTYVMKTVESFGYAFNEDGCLRKIDPLTQKPGNDPFQFQISNSHEECQKNYEDLGETITEYVYELLEKDGLIRLPVPKNSEISSFIYVSEDYQHKDKLLVLIHGSGVVRAGQWARALIINDKLSTGTQIPYIRKARENDFGIIVMNTNDNTREKASKNLKIPNSSSPEEHAEYVWKHYILPAKSKNIAIVAHSYGGIVTLHLHDKYKDDFENRVKAVAFTDSVHSFSKYKVLPHLIKVGRNWVASDDPLDTILMQNNNDVKRVSAGHVKHEMTSFSSMNSVFAFIEQKILNHNENC